MQLLLAELIDILTSTDNELKVKQYIRICTIFVYLNQQPTDPLSMPKNDQMPGLSLQCWDTKVNGDVKIKGTQKL